MTANPPRPPHILLTNDDGIEADGLRAMATALRGLGDLTIVAPSEERSATGHAISIGREMKLETVERDGGPWGWGLSGMPADCVKVARSIVCAGRPIDLVVSGVNRGHNLGINIIYSGTVGAAREAAILGIPSIAVSLFYRDEAHLPFHTAARVGAEIAIEVLARGLPRGIMLNVNVPPIEYEELKGRSIAPMGNSCWNDYFVDNAPTPEHPALLQNIGKGWNPSDIAKDGLDDHALYDDRVCITPIQLDMTAHGYLAELEAWLGNGEREP